MMRCINDRHALRSAATRWGWILLGHLLLLWAGRPADASGAAAQAAAPSLDGEAQSTASIRWTWNDTVGESYYLLHDAETDALVAWLPSDSTQFTESGLSENHRYRRHLHASVQGQLSPPSNEKALYTLVHDPTGADFELSLSGNLAIRVDVVAPPNPAADLTGVEITRNGTGAVSPFAPVYGYTDTGLQPDTEYSYYIRFRNGDGRQTAISYPESLRTPPGEVPPNCRVKLEIPDSPFYLPEGDGDGDEMKPGNSIIAYVSWETDTPDHGPRTRTLTVTLSPSGLLGQCSNSGYRSLEDFTLEASRNAGLWDLVGTDLEYPGDQRLGAKTKEPVPPFLRIPIVITSYDWGGTATVFAEAENCTVQEKGVVEDDDKDRLPNFFEDASFFWLAGPQGRVRTPFSRANPFSAGPTGVRDDLNDLDLDDRPVPVHATPGDGLSAFEEYRGIKVQGKVKRTSDHIDQRTQDRKGGTDRKDLFILDESGAARQQPLFFVNSKYLADSGLIWHMLDFGDVYRQGSLLCMNENERTTQHAIRIRTAGALEVDGRRAAGTADLSIKSALPVRVDLGLVKQSARSLKINLEDLLDWIVSHEVHHKLGMNHNRRELTFLAAAPALPRAGQEANRLNWWIARDKTPEFNVAVLKEKGLVHGLEYVEAIPDLQNDGKNLEIHRQSLGKLLDGQMTIHGDVHGAALYQALLKVAIQQATRQEQKVILASHERNLMDPVIHPRETDAVKQDPLPEKREPEPNVRS